MKKLLPIVIVALALTGCATKRTIKHNLDLTRECYDSRTTLGTAALAKLTPEQILLDRAIERLAIVTGKYEDPCIFPLD